MKDIEACSHIVKRMEQAGVFACVKLWKQSASDNSKYDLPRDKLFFMHACYSVYDCFVKQGLTAIVSVSCLFHFYIHGTDKESKDSHLGLQVTRCHTSKKQGYDSAFLALRFDHYNYLVTIIIPALLFKYVFPRASPSYVNTHSQDTHKACLKHWELISGVATRGKPSELAPLLKAFESDLKNALLIPHFIGNYPKRPLKGIGKLAYAIHKENCVMIKPP